MAAMAATAPAVANAPTPPPKLIATAAKHTATLQSAASDAPCMGNLEAVIETLRASPNVQAREAAVQSLWGVAASETGQIAIREAGGVPLLVRELPRLAAAKALQRLACDAYNEDAIREAGGVAALVALVADASAPADAREAASNALQNLANEDNAANQAAIRECGGLQALASLLSEGSRAAAEALQNLRTDATNAAALDALAASGRFPGAAREACDFGRRERVLPANWDPAVRFTDRFLHEAVLADGPWAIHCALFAPPRPTGAVRIDAVTRPGHPCVGQRGLFAAAALRTGARLLRYCGVSQPRCGDDGDGGYRFALKGELEIDIDALCAGNESRFINDYRGTADRPNVQFIEARSDAGELEVWVEVQRPIAAGEEILVSYGSRYFV